MYNFKELLSLLFFDCETVPQYESLDDMPSPLKELWFEKYHFKAFERVLDSRIKKLALKEKNYNSLIEQKNNYINLIDQPTIDEVYIQEAPLYPEFGKIYCISFGVINEKKEISIDTLCCDDDSEKEMLIAFNKILSSYPSFNLAGYNSNEFDIPYILKRMWINGIVENYAPQLQLRDAKPWTVKHIDHMVNYKAGAWGANTSLAVHCETLGIPSPKDKFNNDEFSSLLMSGKITKEDAIEYCEKDVDRLIRTMLALSSEKSNYNGKK